MSMTESRRQEWEFQKRHGGRVTPASGATPTIKGDWQDRVRVVECKTTGKDSIALQREWLKKLLLDTAGDGRIPAVEVEFQPTERSARYRAYVIPEDAFERWMEKP